MSPLVAALWWGTAAAFAVIFVATLIAQRIDTRRIGGDNVWVKPAKFALSLSTHFATMALALGALDPAVLTQPWLLAVAIAATVCAGLEQAYISFQAARQLPSHFYVRTPVYAALYAAMAVGAVVIVLASGVLGALVWAAPAPGLSEPLRHALAIGLLGGTVLTLITAFRLGGNMSHAIGAEAPGAARMPLTGWSLTVGDLRPAHFLATHMMQALPTVGLIAAWVLPALLATVVVWLAAVIWTWLTLAVFHIALTGRPLFVRPVATKSAA